MWTTLFPERASTMAGRVDALYFFLVAVSAFFSLLISGMVVYFAIRYRRRHEHEVGQMTTGGIVLESVWTIIPLGITMIMFVWGAELYSALYTPPPEALNIYVVGKQWMWKFQHLDGQREINELHVPVNRIVKLKMGSQDVIHSFFVPEFRIKMDVVPGREREIWFEATKRGTYHLFCAEYCGTQHSHMIGRIVVLDPLEYQAWLSGGTSEGSMASAGEKLFQDLACITCHRPDSQGRGPVLQGMYGKTVQLQNGETVLFDDAYIRESILNPAAKITAGFQPLMPTFQGLVSEEQILQLTEYIKSLKVQREIERPGLGPAGPRPTEPTPARPPQPNPEVRPPAQ